MQLPPISRRIKNTNKLATDPLISRQLEHENEIENIIPNNELNSYSYRYLRGISV